MEVVVGYMASLVNACSLIFIAETMFARKRRLYRGIIYIIIPCAFLLWGAISRYMDNIWVSFSGNLILYIGLSLLYYCTPIKALISGLILLCIDLSSFYLTIGLNAVLVMNHHSPIGAYSQIVFTKLVYFMLVSVLIFLLKHKTNSVNPKYAVPILCIQLLSGFILFLILLLIDHRLLYYGYAYGFIGMLLVLLNIFVYALFDSMLQVMTLKKNEMATLKELEISSMKYQMVSENYKQVRRIIHDTNKHLSVLKGYLQHQEWDACMSYLTEMSDTMNRTEVCVNTGNIAMDSLINDLHGKCISNGITCTWEITTNANDFNYEAMDLAIILGNLFDNAYQACLEMVSPDNSHIMIQIYIVNRKLVIKVINSCNVNKPLTEDYGIENIRRTVERLEGFYTYSRNEHTGQYTAQVVLPIE